MRIGTLVRGILAGLLLAVGLAPQAGASTIYAYQGNPMNECIFPADPCSAGAEITAYFSVAVPLNADYSGYPAISALITDNQGTTLSPNPGDVYIKTDSTGKIVEWDLYGTNSTLTAFLSTYSEGIANTDASDRDTVLNTFNDNSQGTWTISLAPEASSWMLMGTGLLAIAALVVWRRRAAARTA